MTPSPPMIDVNENVDMLRSRREEQDRAELLSLLREQENLARMEELRSRQELEEFVSGLEHEKRLSSVLRQQELDQLWSHVAARATEERLRRRLEEMRLVRDVESMRLEIEGLRGALDERRATKRALQRDLADSALGHDPTNDTQDGGATDSIASYREMLRSTSLASAEWALASRMEERMETLLGSLEQFVAEESLTAAAPPLAAADLSIPRPAFQPAALVIASKGLSRLDGYPPHAQLRPRRLQGFASSIRSLNVVFHPDGNVPILLAGHRRGIAHLDPTNANVIASYPIEQVTHYAFNASGFLRDGRLLATHSQLGVVAWEAPDRLPEVVSGDIRTARLLRILKGGKVALFASEDRLICFDSERGTTYDVRALDGRVITSLDLAGQFAVMGDTHGAVTVAELRDSNLKPPPILVGEKVYAVGTFEWRGSTYIAAGVKRRTGIYLVLKDLKSEAPEIMLSVPERLHTIRQAGPGRLLATSERFLSYWDLNVSDRSQVISLAEIAPVQDIAAVRD